jgi:two-component system, cell cycle sensor histidine kinase and response regulator CckA
VVPPPTPPDDPRLPPDFADPLRQILDSSERAAGLTRQLLAFSRRQVMQMQVLSLNEVVGNLSRMLDRILGEDVTPHLHLDGHLPPVRADAGMLEQVLMNLAVNARDAMPQGGHLTVTTDAVTLDAAAASHNPEAREGRFVRLMVTDTGAGITPDVMGHLFEPFFTTKEVGKGTGLGLATVHGVVKQHQGWIEVRSAPGEGATFEVYLPAAAATGTVHGTARVDPLRGGSETILVVEDEAPLLDLVTTVLGRLGYQVLTARTGPEAIAVWRDQAGRIALLLTDLVMPDGMTGQQLADRLREEQPGLKVLITSGYNADIAGRDLALDAATAFMRKPYGAQQLARAVRAILDA